MFLFLLWTFKCHIFWLTLKNKFWALYSRFWYSKRVICCLTLLNYFERYLIILYWYNLSIFLLYFFKNTIFWKKLHQLIFCLISVFFHQVFCLFTGFQLGRENLSQSHPGRAMNFDIYQEKNHPGIYVY